MKTSLLLALIASTALATGALAQSTATGTATPPTVTTPGTGGTSSATGSNTGSGSTTGMGSSSSAPATPDTSGSATPGSQSPNPKIHGNSSGGPQWNQGGWSGQPMMQGMMTCVSPAPMGGFGSFACYPAGWGMGMDGMDWHHRHHGSWGHGGDFGYTPNDHYQERQTWRGKRDRSRVPGWDNDGGSSGGGNGYDNDWRSDGSGHDGNGSDDYPNP